MNDEHDLDPTDDAATGDGAAVGDDASLVAAGAELRRQVHPISAAAVQAAVWRRRARGLGVAAAASLVVVALLAGLLVLGGANRADDLAGLRAGAPSPEAVDRLLGSLDDQPVDPTTVRLVASVSTFDSCDALIGDLRRVGAEHVGSRGFGDPGGWYPRMADTAALDVDGAARSMAAEESSQAATTIPSSEAVTLGTNVQVVGVDEPDLVKAEGDLIYDLDREGDLRITDATSLSVVSTLDVTPVVGDGTGEEGSASVSQLLVAGSRVALFGSEEEIVGPLDDDPSATRSARRYLTVTFVDASDPAAPAVTDRVRIEGRLVSARRVGDEIRMVATSNMADLGFVVPTSPASVPKALEMNRRSVATSTVADWIPDWQRAGEQPQPLVPCERVHVPDTFAGVAMTSMVTVGLGAGRFDPLATSILAPANTLYAGVEVVAISAEVWVDPIDRDRLAFEDWRTAIHEFRFADASAPSYEGSGIVDGSTIGQFAFGEIGESVAVVTTTGSPWQQDPAAGVDLTIFTPDGAGGLSTVATVEDLADGAAVVNAVRFVGERVLVSTGGIAAYDPGLPFGEVSELSEQRMVVIDVANPAAPRRAGTLLLEGAVDYFHPLPDSRALAVGSRSDWVGEGEDRQVRTWVEVQLVDLGAADLPAVIDSWERPWSSDDLAGDHRAFTWWPDRNLAMWGLRTTGPGYGYDQFVNAAVVLEATGRLEAVAVPSVSPAPEVAPPCPVFEPTNPDWQQYTSGQVVLRCTRDALVGGDDRIGTTGTVDWPRHRCFAVSAFSVVGGDPTRLDLEAGEEVFLSCSLRPNPVVSRVLVVAGIPILYTDQTLEALDPSTFTSTAVAYHPSSWY